MGRVDNKVALVTGGASGLGKAIAQRLLQEGARVVITDLQIPLGQAVAREFGCEFHQQDVTSEAQWRALIDEIQKKHGGLHILVNNAGITGSMDHVTPEDTTLPDWRKVQQVNVEGVVLGCRAVIPALRRSGGGAIINLSSIAALVAMPDGMAYGASKAAVRHITKSVALHCARDGSEIRCNSVHPGNIFTPMLQQAMEGIAQRRGVPYEQVVAEFKAENPQGEFQEPQDIAHAVLFLASDEAKHITGVQLVVDGGTTLACG